MQVPSEGVWLAYDLSGEVTSQLAFGSIGIYMFFNKWEYPHSWMVYKGKYR